MDLGIARHFRDEFRQAREVAYANAENFQDLLFSLERLGFTLTKGGVGLNAYREKIRILAEESPLAKEIPQVHREWHVPFSELYEVVRIARNDALHQGAFARHLASHLTLIALVLEDALMAKSDANKVVDYMVRSPVNAALWQPVSFIRQQMLANSFTYLPFLNADGKWALVSDYNVARYLRSRSNRNELLAKTLDDAISESDGLKTHLAKVCYADETIEKVLDSFDGEPFLVVRRKNESDLLGILTAFDLL